MDTRSLIENNGDMLFPNYGIGFLWCPKDENLTQSGGFFASVGQMGKGGFGGVSPNSKNTNEGSGIKLPYSSKFVSTPESNFRVVGVQEIEEVEELVGGLTKKKKGGLKLKIKVGNPSLRRLISGGIAGAVSRTFVAPLETIRTHLMVGSCGQSSTEVFQDIMKTDGWTGLFRGNLVNVIRVAPSKAIEVRVNIYASEFVIFTN